MPSLPAILLAAAAAVPAFAAAQPAACPQFFARGRQPALLNPRLAQRATVLCNEGYAVAASGLTHGALWSAEHLTAASVAAARDTPRVDAFHAEDRLPPADQAQIEDYRSSGYDRGHMAPSGDMPDPAAQEQSFSLANMVPQTAKLNRGIWEGVESAVRNLATAEGELYLVTGPAFQGSRVKSIGPDGVLVPTATWKAVYDPRQGTGAYLCRNTTRPTCTVVSVSALATLTGIDAFPGLPAAAKATAIQLPAPEASSYMQRRGRSRRQGGGRSDQMFSPMENR